MTTTTVERPREVERTRVRKLLLNTETVALLNIDHSAAARLVGYVPDTQSTFSQPTCNPADPSCQTDSLMSGGCTATCISVCMSCGDCA